MTLQICNPTKKNLQQNWPLAHLELLLRTTRCRTVLKFALFTPRSYQPIYTTKNRSRHPPWAGPELMFFDRTPEDHHEESVVAMSLSSETETFMGSCWSKVPFMCWGLQWLHLGRFRSISGSRFSFACTTTLEEREGTKPFWLGKKHRLPKFLWLLAVSQALGN